VNEVRNGCTGLGPVHFFQKLAMIAAGASLAAIPLTPAQAEQAATAVTAASAAGKPQFSQTAADFYRLRRDAPLWLSAASGDAAQQLIMLLSTASFDGLSPDKYHPAALQAALDAARSGKPRRSKRRTSNCPTRSRPTSPT